MESHKVSITVDVEEDCPPYLNTWRGMEEGMPKLLDMLSEEGVLATFFCTGEAAEKFPDAIQDVVRRGHELGCHSQTHVRFDRISDKEAKQEIRKGTDALRSFAPITSFRAPYLQFPQRYTDFLREEGYALDSSEARYKDRKVQVRTEDQLVRVPVSATPPVIRFPKWLRERILRRLKDPVVLFVHPWEFVDFRKSSLRLDCRFKTGFPALQALRETIHYFRQDKREFLLLNQLASGIDRPVLT